MEVSIRIDINDLTKEEGEKTNGDDSSQIKSRFGYGSPAQLLPIHNKSVPSLYRSIVGAISKHRQT